MQPNQARPLSIKILIGLLFFIALGGILCGIILMVDPSGQYIGLPLSLLDNTPLNDFTLVGLWLFSVYGVFPLFTAYGMLTRRNWSWTDVLSKRGKTHWTWTATVSLGIILVLWSITETILWRRLVDLTVIYGALGIILILLPLTSSAKRHLALAQDQTR